MNKRELLEQITKERGVGCEICGWNLGTELHHCLIHRMKGHPELDVPENLELLCKECHANGYVNSYQHRVGFWNTQKERGYKMKEWLDGLGLLIKESFE